MPMIAITTRSSTKVNAVVRRLRYWGGNQYAIGLLHIQLVWFVGN